MCSSDYCNVINEKCNILALEEQTVPVFFPQVTFWWKLPKYQLKRLCLFNGRLLNQLGSQKFIFPTKKAVDYLLSSKTNTESNDMIFLTSNSYQKEKELNSFEARIASIDDKYYWNRKKPDYSECNKPMKTPLYKSSLIVSSGIIGKDEGTDNFQEVQAIYESETSNVSDNPMTNSCYYDDDIYVNSIKEKLQIENNPKNIENKTEYILNSSQDNLSTRYSSSLKYCDVDKSLNIFNLSTDSCEKVKTFQQHECEVNSLSSNVKKDEVAEDLFITPDCLPYSETSFHEQNSISSTHDSFFDLNDMHDSYYYDLDTELHLNNFIEDNDIEKNFEGEETKIPMSPLDEIGNWQIYDKVVDQCSNSSVKYQSFGNYLDNFDMNGVLLCTSDNDNHNKKKNNDDRSTPTDYDVESSTDNFSSITNLIYENKNTCTFETKTVSTFTPHWSTSINTADKINEFAELVNKTYDDSTSHLEHEVNSPENITSNDDSYDHFDKISESSANLQWNSNCFTPTHSDQEDIEILDDLILLTSVKTVKTNANDELPSLLKTTPRRKLNKECQLDGSPDYILHESNYPQFSSDFYDIDEASPSLIKKEKKKLSLKNTSDYQNMSFESLFAKTRVLSAKKQSEIFEYIRKTFVKKWYNKFNNAVFKNMLPNDVNILWNFRLTKTAGQTVFKMNKQGVISNYTIHLSCKVVNDKKRCKTTILHEMCHLAQLLIDHEDKPPHGPAFQKWAKIANSLFPDIGVTTTHKYQIHKPYRYQCLHCKKIYSRFSKYINTNRLKCKSYMCFGKLKLLRSDDDCYI